MSTLKVDAIRHNSATSDAITTAADGTCTAKLTSIGGGGLSHRNIIINGAMTVAQRSTSVSSSGGGYLTVDRFKYVHNGNDNNLTQSQADVASGTTPYTLGFRKSYKLTNGNQTGGAGTGDRCRLQVNIEAQDIANSGWNYKSSSSFITLSFWVKSSVAQNFFGSIRTPDGTSQGYSFETGSLTADTWTKITKTIPGNSNLTFNNDAELGWNMDIAQFIGTDRTSSGNTMNQWAAYDSNNVMPDNTGTWYTTNGATWEITGIQLEVGDTATSFEHRSFGEELYRCQRYYFKFCEGNNKEINVAWYFTSSHISFFIRYPTTMRAAPTLSITTGTNYYILYRNGGNDQFDGFASEFISTEQMSCFRNSQVSGTAGQAGILRTYNSAAKVEISAEL